jgi:hypothetical protein
VKEKYVAREKLESNFDNTPTISPGDMQKGDEVSGKFIGLKQVKVKNRDATILRLEDKNGVAFNMWSNASIGTQLDSLQENEVYIFVALGKQRNENTGRDFNAFDVYHGTPDELTFDIESALEPEPEPVPVAGRKGRK